MKPVSTRLTEEDIERVDNMREGGEARGTALRRIIRTGLEQKEETDESVPLPFLTAWFGSLLIAVPLTEPATVDARLLVVAGILLIVGGIGYPAAVRRFHK